jgi:hypothetical protein
MPEFSLPLLGDVLRTGGIGDEKRGQESQFVGFCIASVLSHSYYMNRTTRYEFINIMLDALSVRYKGD